MSSDCRGDFPLSAAGVFAFPRAMRILISGICGFVGSTLAKALVESGKGHHVLGFYNFIRPGSETNRAALKALGVRLYHGDLRAASDLEPLPDADWIVDAAANPSVLAGIDGRTSSRQLVEHNLGGTVTFLGPQRRSLEEVFIEKVGEESQ